MAQEFEYNMKLKQMEVDASTKKEAQIEDRKDKRTKIQASQQSQMITQRQTDGLPTDFENNMRRIKYVIFINFYIILLCQKQRKKLESLR